MKFLESHQCCAWTNSGQRCAKRYRGFKNNYCWHHTPRANPLILTLVLALVGIGCRAVYGIVTENRMQHKILTSAAATQPIRNLFVELDFTEKLSNDEAMSFVTAITFGKDEGMRFSKLVVYGAYDAKPTNIPNSNNFKIQAYSHTKANGYRDLSDTNNYQVDGLPQTPESLMIPIYGTKFPPFYSVNDLDGVKWDIVLPALIAKKVSNIRLLANVPFLTGKQLVVSETKTALNLWEDAKLGVDAPELKFDIASIPSGQHKAFKAGVIDIGSVDLETHVGGLLPPYRVNYSARIPGAEEAM